MLNIPQRTRTKSNKTYTCINNISAMLYNNIKKGNDTIECS